MESAELVEAPVEAPVTETPVVEESSIADHAQQFNPDAGDKTDVETERPAANTGQFANRPPDARHKASSQRATPEDVAEINRLTKELRETEQRLADKDPDAAASPRIRTLRRQISALKALEAPASDPVTRPVASRAPEPVASGEFTEKEPKLDDFADADDPYSSWQRALGRYDRRLESWQAQQEQRTSAETQREQQVISSYNERVQAFTREQPDFQSVTAPLMNQPLPPLFLHAIVRDDNAAQYVYYLAQHPELVDELFLLTDGKTVTDASVATVQRRLKQHALAAQSTGSAAVPARPTYTPPRPPNPVRTGPIKTSDEPPGETASISDHAKYYGPKAK